MNARVMACATGLDVMTYLLRSLRKLDFQAVDEAKQQPEVTYADRARAVPIYDAVESGRRCPRFTPRSAADDVITELAAVSPPCDGFAAHRAEYDALMARADELTGTTRTFEWEPGAPIAMAAVLVVPEVAR